MRNSLLAAAVALAAGPLLAACGGGGGSGSSAAPTTTATELPASKTVDVTHQDDSNWSGYVLTNATFSGISGSWTQPAVDCSVASPAYSAFWVGLGGYSSDHLEQIGTEAACSASGRAVYSAWYELLPAPQITLKVAVAPGDRLSARVAVAGDTVTLSLRDLTSHATFSKSSHMATPSRDSAEWIAEAPSNCRSSTNCDVLPLADFGSVTFTHAAASVGDRVGPIDSGLGSVKALTLETNPGFGRLRHDSAAANASVGALSGSGSSFTVKWEQPTVTLLPVPIGPIVVAVP